MRGQILHGVHRECAEVVIRNLTEGGAKVRLVSTVGVAIRGRLVLRLDSGDRPGVVAWQSGNEIGLRFDRDPTPPEPTHSPKDTLDIAPLDTRDTRYTRDNC